MLSQCDAEVIIKGKLLENFLHINGYRAVACSPSGELFKISRALIRPPTYNHWYSSKIIFRQHPDLLCIDVYDGVIDLHGIAERMNRWTEYGDGEDWQKMYLKRFAHLDGWSVCFHEDQVDISKEAIMNLWTPHEPPYQLSASAVGGRPKERDEAAKAYHLLFPLGHGNLSWKQVCMKISEHSNITVSLSTLKRGLEEFAQNPAQNPAQNQN